MDNIADHCRHIVRYHFHIGLSAEESAHKICAVYGHGAIEEEVVQEWFASLRAGNFTHKDTKRSGRSTKLLSSANKASQNEGDASSISMDKAKRRKKNPPVETAADLKDRNSDDSDYRLNCEKQTSQRSTHARVKNVQPSNSRRKSNPAMPKTFPQVAPSVESDNASVQSAQQLTLKKTASTLSQQSRQRGCRIAILRKRRLENLPSTTRELEPMAEIDYGVDSMATEYLYNIDDTGKADSGNIIVTRCRQIQPSSNRLQMETLSRSNRTTRQQQRNEMDEEHQQQQNQNNERFVESPLAGQLIRPVTSLESFIAPIDPHIPANQLDEEIAPNIESQLVQIVKSELTEQEKEHLGQEIKTEILDEYDESGGAVPQAAFIKIEPELNYLKEIKTEPYEFEDSIPQTTIVKIESGETATSLYSMKNN